MDTETNEDGSPLQAAYVDALKCATALWTHFLSTLTPAEVEQINLVASSGIYPGALITLERREGAMPAGLSVVLIDPQGGIQKLASVAERQNTWH